MYKLFSFQLQVSISFAFIFLISQQVQSQELLPSDSLTAVLTAKENEMFSIIINGSREEAEKLIAHDYITINANGVMDGKDNTLKTIRKFKGSTAKLSDKKLRVYGNIAIINGKATSYIKQFLVAETFYTEIWVYRSSQWQFIGWQGTMTGLPSYYPIILTILIVFLIYLTIQLIIRRRKRHLE